MYLEVPRLPWLVSCTLRNACQTQLFMQIMTFVINMLQLTTKKTTTTKTKTTTTNCCNAKIKIIIITSWKQFLKFALLIKYSKKLQSTLINIKHDNNSDNNCKQQLHSYSYSYSLLTAEDPRPEKRINKNKNRGKASSVRFSCDLRSLLLMNLYTYIIASVCECLLVSVCKCCLQFG